MIDTDKQQNKKPAVPVRIVRWLKNHPLTFNILLIGVCSLLVVWGLMVFLGFLTEHGVEQSIPDVKGLDYKAGENVLVAQGLKAEISDSIFDISLTPGTIVDQTPRPDSRVKPGRTVFLTIVAFSPKMVRVPDFVNVSMRQGVSLFEGIGIKKIEIRRVDSEYKDLVLGAKFNGLPLRAGQKIPINATVTIEVGSGFDEENPDNTEDSGYDL